MATSTSFRLSDTAGSLTGSLEERITTLSHETTEHSQRTAHRREALLA